MITIALSKGRIFQETTPLLAAAGIHALEDPEASRKLILPTNREDVRLIIVRASDVPTYVQYGAADLGIAGKDVLDEHGGEGLYQPIDLQIAKCKMMVAVREDFDYFASIRSGARLKVVTKYVKPIVLTPAFLDQTRKLRIPNSTTLRSLLESSIPFFPIITC